MNDLFLKRFHLWLAHRCELFMSADYWMIGTE